MYQNLLTKVDAGVGTITPTAPGDTTHLTMY